MRHCAKFALFSVLGSTCSLLACGSTPPPASQFPDAKSAIARLDATYATVSGIRADAKIDYLGARGRVRGDLKLIAAAPAGLRFAITAAVVGSAGEIASDGKFFEADDKTNGRFLVGEATPCNIAKLTQVPLPSREFVPMLWGMRPAIDTPVISDSLRWSDAGYYIVMLVEDASKVATQGGTYAHELHLAPTPSDWNKPFSQQRVRLLEVDGWTGPNPDAQLVYRVEMRDHAPTQTAAPIQDPDGLTADLAPSGPMQTVDVPRAIHVEVPSKHSDVVLKYGETFIDPPLMPSVFRLQIPVGAPVERVRCE